MPISGYRHTDARYIYIETTATDNATGDHDTNVLCFLLHHKGLAIQVEVRPRTTWHRAAATLLSSDPAGSLTCCLANNDGCNHTHDCGIEWLSFATTASRS